MSCSNEYTNPSNFDENDEIYDEETDYYIEDDNLCSHHQNTWYLNETPHYTELNYWI